MYCDLGYNRKIDYVHSTSFYVKKFILYTYNHIIQQVRNIFFYLSRDSIYFVGKIRRALLLVPQIYICIDRLGIFKHLGFESSFCKNDVGDERQV